VQKNVVLVLVLIIENTPAAPQISYLQTPVRGSPNRKPKTENRKPITQKVLLASAILSRQDSPQDLKPARILEHQQNRQNRRLNPREKGFSP
jgi:hypothetical protein